jgi:SAM-dependent methyltransferase
MWWFLRKSAIAREPLAITLSGVRPGERLLQINIDDPRTAGAVASKVGISGEAAIVVTDERAAERAHRAGRDAGALLDVKVAAVDELPFADDAFDVVLIHSRHGFLANLDAELRARALREGYRVLRTGGRMIALEPGTPSGLRALLTPSPKSGAGEGIGGGTVGALVVAGFRPVRVLADREGARFIEGLKRD